MRNRLSKVGFVLGSPQDRPRRVRRIRTVHDRRDERIDPGPYVRAVYDAMQNGDTSRKSAVKECNARLPSTPSRPTPFDAQRSHVIVSWLVSCWLRDGDPLGK